MKSGLYIVQNALGGKKPDILKGSRHAETADFMGLLSHQILTVQTDAAVSGAVYTCQHVENGGFSGTVGSDEADQASLFDFHGQLIDRAQTAEGDAQTGDFQHCHVMPPPFRVSLPPFRHGPRRVFPAAVFSGLNC